MGLARCQGVGEAGGAPETLHPGLRGHTAPALGAWALPAAPSPLSTEACSRSSLSASLSTPWTSVPVPLLPKHSHQLRKPISPDAALASGVRGRSGAVPRTRPEWSLWLMVCGSLPTSCPDPVFRTPEPQATGHLSQRARIGSATANLTLS